MDIQQVAKQLLNYLGENPQLITQLIEHPYSTTAQAVGTEEQISKKDMSQILTAAAALSNNQQLGGSDVSNIASALLGQNNNSVHSLASMLFGGGNTQQSVQMAQQQTTSAGTLDLGSLVNMATLAATLMGGAAAANAQQQQVQQQVQQTQQASGGLNLGNIMTIASLASQFLGAANSKPQAAAQQVATPKPQAVKPQAVQQPQQQASGGLDFGTIAQLASVLLKQQ